MDGAAGPSSPPAGDAGEAVGVACDSLAGVHGLRCPLFRSCCSWTRCCHSALDWRQRVFIVHTAIVIGLDDTVYCTDDFGHAVRAFSTDGEPRFTLGASGKPSDTKATSIDYRTIRRAGPPFNYPTNLAIGPSGDLYVSDGYGNARIHRFAPDGRLVRSWGEPGSGPSQFYVPHGIAVDSAGIVYVADRENNRIQLFTDAGKYIGEWTDVARPCQLYIDKAGWIYVAELGYRAGRWPGTGAAQPGQTGGRVSIFDRAGVLHARWGGGERPCDPGDFFAPHGLWVDSRGDLYVAEVTLSGGGRTGMVPGSCHTFQKFTKSCVTES